MSEATKCENVTISSSSLIDGKVHGQNVCIIASNLCVFCHFYSHTKKKRKNKRNIKQTKI